MDINGSRKNDILGSEIIEFHRIFCKIAANTVRCLSEASSQGVLADKRFAKNPSMKFVFLTLICRSFSIHTSITYCIYTTISITFSIQFNQLHNNINTHIHSFNTNMFIRSMISMSTSSKIRTRKSSET